jgi:hypothetical protein
MATLWWAWTQHTLSDTATDIGEVKAAIAANLPRLGYTDIVNTGDLHGAKADFHLAVVFLGVGGRDFWQMVACGGNGPVPGAEAEVAQVQEMIANLRLLQRQHAATGTARSDRRGDDGTARYRYSSAAVRQAGKRTS